MVKPRIDPVVQRLIDKTYKELAASSPDTSYPSPGSSYHMAQPKTPFRIPTLEKTKYQSPTGTTYRYSALYRNAVIVQLFVEKWTSGLDQKQYHRLIVQDNDAARSMVANIAEGYARPSTKEYLDFLGYSRASLEEITTDIMHAKDLSLLPSRPGSSLDSIGIELRPGVELGEVKRKVGEVKREDLTFEILIELINKTNYLYKRTVEGLWNKFTADERTKWRGIRF